MTAAHDEPVRVPPGLRERVLAASWRERAAGQAFPEVAEISPVQAFSRAADAFHGLLCALGSVDWPVPVLRGLHAQGLVGHLIGVEEAVQRCLDGDAEVAETDHVLSTDPVAAGQAGRSPAQTRDDWRRAADRTLGLLRRRDLGARVALHGMRLPVGALLVVRAFELWTHENDIRLAVGRPASVPDAPTLRLMTGLAARLMPHAAARTGLREPIDLHLVLTGPGGGTWDLAIGEGRAQPARVAIVADAVAYCRLAANRVGPGGLNPHVTGDPGRAARVLAAAAALALD
jgi:uncharacterized protein (TIGR03083 family)